MIIKKLKWLCALICALLLFSLPMTTLAAELDETSTIGSAIITAEVPSVHTITVDTDAADVFVNEQPVTDTAKVERQSTPTLLVRAESGYQVKTVLLDGVDVTNQLKIGMFSLPNVITDHTVTVTTNEYTPPNQKTYNVSGILKKNGSLTPDITLELRSKLKTTVTDSDGSFLFKSVESGHHSLTALQDNKVIGYTEFTIDSFSSELDNNGIVEVIVNEDTIGINMELELFDDDRVLHISNVQVIGATKLEPERANPPDTGDTSTMALWLVILIVSGSVLAIVIILTKRQGSKK